MIKYIAGVGSGLMALGVYLAWEGVSFMAKAVMTAGLLFMVWLIIEV